MAISLASVPTKPIYQETIQPDTYKPKYPSSNPILTRSRSIIHESRKSPPCITVGLRPQLEAFESNSPLEFKVIYLGEPCPLTTWKKDNVPITENVKTKTNCSILVLDSVEADNAGVYSCTVENSEGKVETRCQLSVLPKKPSQDSQISRLFTKPCPPAIIDHLKSIQAIDGGEIELSCKIVCPPCSFDVVWIHNGKEIKPSKDFQYHHVESKYSLKIPELFPEDSGIYTCEAFNDHGETFTTCSLYVTCPGKEGPADIFKTFPKSVSVTRGAPVVITAELVPGCDRQVTWIKDGNVIDQTNINDKGHVQFSIVEAGIRDTGLYEMHATTNGEEHAAAFAIIVL